MSLTIELAEKLQGEIQQMGAAIVLPPRDAHLALPHSSFLTELFEWVKKTTPAYQNEAWDCDDFAMNMVVRASERLAALHPNCGHSILFCVLVIIEGSDLNGVRGGSHATNLVKTSDKGWLFFEPQNGRISNALEALNDSVGSIDFVLL